MEDKDREIWVGKNRMYLGEDNILRITAVGELDMETMSAMYDAVIKFLNMVGGKLNVIIDINKTGKMSTGARKAGAKMADNEKVGKIAFLGLHPVARVIASFFMGVSQKKDMRFFRTEEEALAWLKE
jgi:hypothetical protein